MSQKYKNILSSFTFPVSGIQVNSRIALAPVTAYSGNGDGTVSDEDVALMRRVVGPKMGVKASGGIRDYKTAVAKVYAGANRIGA